jgi:DNA-binding response OmpR family regulator
VTLLAQEPGRVFTRDEIVRHLWESDFAGDRRAIDVHISNLRRKLETDPRNPRRLVTVRGVGYKLVAT